MFRRSPALASIFLGMLVIVLAGRTDAAIVWNITYEDSGFGDGFDDPLLGESRRSTFESVLAYVNSVVDENGAVDLLIRRSQFDGTGFLGAAGGGAVNGPPGFYNGRVFEHATTGIDPDPGQDVGIRFDFGFNWNLELDELAPGERDLFSIALHEVTHTMGFASRISAAGVSRISGTDPGVFSVLNMFMARGDGTLLFGEGGDFIGSLDDLTSDDVYFIGPNAMAANDGQPVKLFAPVTFGGGSSLSHLDPSAGGVMRPGSGVPELRRTYSTVELGILADIGWTLHAVPEPSTFALVGLGSAVLVYSGWRRRRKGAIAS